MKAQQFVDANEKELSTDKPISIKPWDEFRKTGLFLIVNQLLHAFGWCLVLVCDENNSVTEVKAARTIFKGFSEDAQAEDYTKLAKYLGETGEQLAKEVDL